MTWGTRLHLILCAFGFHIWGRWRTRVGRPGQYRACRACRDDQWRPNPSTPSKADQAEAMEP